MRLEVIGFAVFAALVENIKANGSSLPTCRPDPFNCDTIESQPFEGDHLRSLPRSTRESERESTCQ